MSRRRRPKPDLTDLAAELGPEDGGDPKEFHGKPWDREKPAGRKALQLCGQVQDALHAALAACGDGVLQSLRVARVVWVGDRPDVGAALTTDTVGTERVVLGVLATAVVVLGVLPMTVLSVTAGAVAGLVGAP